MKILLIGASSYVGARLFLDISKEHTVIGTFSSSVLSDAFIHLDITDRSEIHDVIQKHRPDVIVHAANNASAKWCAEHPDLAVSINQTATEYILTAANAANCDVIYISSTSADDTTTIYGQTKRASERIVTGAKKRYLILRPSLILGCSPNTTNDRPFNRVLKNITEGTPAVYDTSWHFQPTYIRHISEVILQSLAKNIFNETIPICVPEFVSRYDVARDIVKPFGCMVTPIDAKDTGTVLNVDQSQLKKNGLPTYTYEEIIEQIIEEIKNRKDYIL